MRELGENVEEEDIQRVLAGIDIDKDGVLSYAGKRDWHSSSSHIPQQILAPFSLLTAHTVSRISPHNAYACTEFAATVTKEMKEGGTLLV